MNVAEKVEACLRANPQHELTTSGPVWQLTSADDEWRFGRMVRGIVRHSLGEVYFRDDMALHPGYGWRWMLEGELREKAVPLVIVPDGNAGTLQEAVEIIEAAYVKAIGPLV